MHCFSDEKVALAYFEFRRNALGVGTGGGGMFARVRHNQECVGIIERGQDQSIALLWLVGVRRGTGGAALSGGQQVRPSGNGRRRDGRP